MTIGLSGYGGHDWYSTPGSLRFRRLPSEPLIPSRSRSLLSFALRVCALSEAELEDQFSPRSAYYLRSRVGAVPRVADRVGERSRRKLVARCRH